MAADFAATLRVGALAGFLPAGIFLAVDLAAFSVGFVLLTVFAGFLLLAAVLVVAATVVVFFLVVAFAATFFAGDFFPAGFLAGAFLAGAFFAGVFLAGAFFTGTFLVAGLLAGAFLAGAFLGAFLTAFTAFFGAADFFADGCLAAVLLALAREGDLALVFDLLLACAMVEASASIILG